jgi:hypothetical protein
MIGGYTWLDERALWVLVGAVLIPIVGIAAAWVGSTGRSDRDGRLFADLTLGLGFVLFALEILAVSIAEIAFDKGLLDANFLLLVAPLLALGLSLLGIRLIFPLSELGSAQTARDVFLFVVALLVVVWLFSKFRGWGIVFFGGLVQLLLVGVLLAFLLRYLFRRLR